VSFLLDEFRLDESLRFGLLPLVVAAGDPEDTLRGYAALYLGVDFVVYGEAGFWAIEVKNTRRVQPEDLVGLKSFSAGYPECKPLLLYRGPERLKIERIQCLPVEEFLRDLKPSQESIASK
jgi:hypothetical protein